jgi:hypothetical protein
MTETIQQLKEDIAVLQEKLNKLEEIEKQPKITLENEGTFEIVYYNNKCYVRMDYSYDTLWYMSKNTKDFDGNNLILITDDVTRNVLEGLWYDQVKKDEPTKPMDEVVERLVKEHQAQKLWNRLQDELGFTVGGCDRIVDLVEDWILDEQNADGSQNVNTELLVEGFNDAIRKMKEMLR